MDLPPSTLTASAFLQKGQTGPSGQRLRSKNFRADCSSVVKPRAMLFSQVFSHGRDLREDYHTWGYLTEQ
jgi:hypothetical protein